MPHDRGGGGDAMTTWTHGQGDERTVLLETARETIGTSERVRVRYIEPIDSEPVYGWQPTWWLRLQGWVEGVTQTTPDNRQGG
jgi:hypothetical protein